MLTHVGQPSLPAGNLPVQKNQVSAVLVQSTPHISGTSIPVPSTPHVSAISASTQGTPRAAVTCVPVQPVSPASSNPVPATPVNVPVSVPVNVPGQYSGGPQTKSGSAMDMLKGIVTLAAKGVGQSLGVWTPTDVVVNGARLTSQEIQQLR